MKKKHCDSKTMKSQVQTLKSILQKEQKKMEFQHESKKDVFPAKNLRSTIEITGVQFTCCDALMFTLHDIFEIEKGLQIN